MSAGLRPRRLALGLDQADLADVLGVKQLTVSRWETGDRSIPPGVVDELDALEAAQDALVALYAAADSDLVAYGTEEAFWAAHPTFDGVPLAVQHVAVARARRLRGGVIRQG